MLAELLKEKTFPEHQNLENKLVSKMRSMASINDYSRLLQLFYSYFGGLEKLIHPYINSKELPDLTERRKANLISSDLITLGIKIPLITRDNELPSINNSSEAFGALYVMEGSTLGGQIIKIMVSKQLGIPENYATSFFNGYGNETMKMWTAFQQLLNHDNLFKNPNDVIDSANEAFTKFSQFFDIHYGSEHLKGKTV